METIKIHSAIGVNEKIILFETEQTNELPGGVFFFGWRSQYTGPRDPEYATKGANYKGAIIYEIPRTIAEAVEAYRAQDTATLATTESDTLFTAGRVIGICDALAYNGTPADPFENIAFFY